MSRGGLIIMRMQDGGGLIIHYEVILHALMMCMV